ncbi:hypothetical protein LEP1GSC099_2391 [Leptospira interrogans str. UI 08452]|nr:hypothetical protein LEP1GSC099_2391 [Leptospira interrogans str. UI 08452]
MGTTIGFFKKLECGISHKKVHKFLNQTYLRKFLHLHKNAIHV